MRSSSYEWCYEIRLLHTPPHWPYHRAAHRDQTRSQARSYCILCKAERIEGTDSSKGHHRMLLPKQHATTKHLSVLNRRSAQSEAACWRGVLTSAQQQAHLNRKYSQVTTTAQSIVGISPSSSSKGYRNPYSTTECLLIHSSPMWDST